MAFDRSGRWLAAATGRHIRVFDTATGERVAELRGHSEQVLTLCFDPTGERLFSGARDRTIRVWETEHWFEVGLLRGHRSYVVDLAMTPEGGTLLSASGDGTVRLWEPVTASERHEARRRGLAGR